MAVTLTFAESRLTSGQPTLAPWLRRNSLAIGIGLLSVLGSMLLIFFEPTVANGQSVWLLSEHSDIWVQWQAAGLLPDPGGYSHIFAFDDVLKTPPGWEVLISPIAHHFLSWPFPSLGHGFGIPHPKALWVAGPTELAAVPFCLCAIDVWLRRLGVSVARRVWALVALAVVLPPASLWGHPEDLMALGCALLSIRAIRDDRRSAGWWMGFALAFQVEAILLVPLCLVLISGRRRVAYLAQSVAIPLAVLAVPLIEAPRLTIDALLHQAIFAGGDRYTPTQRVVPDSATAVDFVTLGLAALIAVAVWRRRDRISDSLVFWLVGVVYVLRFVYPSLYPYYVVPAIAVFCAASAVLTKPRFSANLVLAIAMTWWTEHDVINGSWLFWFGIGWPLAMMALFAFPFPSARRSVRVDEEPMLDSNRGPPVAVGV